MMVGAVAGPVRELRPRGPFDLDQALAFLRGFGPARLPDGLTDYRAAHVVDGRPALVRLAQPAPGRLELSVAGDDVGDSTLDAAERLVRRNFSLDWDGDDFSGRADGDPVLAEVQRRAPGLRPVLLGSPFEALVWAIVSQRVTMSQGTKIKVRLAERYGPAVEADGRVWRAFPSPADLLALDADGAAAVGLPLGKLAWLRGLAERGLDGDFEPERLLALGSDAARADLRRSKGVGPWASEFCLIRGVGYPDLLPHGERRLTRALRDAYGLGGDPTDAEIARLAEAWRPWRSWAVFLFRSVWQADEAARRGPASAATGGPDDER